MHALPDLRIAGGRLRDVVLPRMPQQTGIESTNPFDDVIQLVEISPSHETLPILPTNIFR